MYNVLNLLNIVVTYFIKYKYEFLFFNKKYINLKFCKQLKFKDSLMDNDSNTRLIEGGNHGL